MERNLFFKQKLDKTTQDLIDLPLAQVHLLALQNGTAERQFKNKNHEKLEDVREVKNGA